MYSDRFSIAFVCDVLIAAAERQRPALGTWSPEVRDKLRDVFDAELKEIEQRFAEVFEDKPYLERMRQSVMEVAFPRYCAVAEKQTALEHADYRLWRGGDLLARTAYMIGGLAFGLFVVKAPFIPIPESWDFVILMTMVGAPFLPDAQVALYKRRYRKALERIVDDMREAAQAQRLYEPLTPPNLQPDRTNDPSLLEPSPPESERPRNGLRER